MPYRTTSRWVNPKRLLKHKGIAIYHTYEDDDIDNGEQRYWFTTFNDENCESFVNRDFDVRYLSTWTEPTHPPYTSGLKGDALHAANKAWEKYWADKVEFKHIKGVIKAAIDKGEINANGIFKT